MDDSDLRFLRMGNTFVQSPSSADEGHGKSLLFKVCVFSCAVLSNSCVSHKISFNFNSYHADLFDKKCQDFNILQTYAN